MSDPAPKPGIMAIDAYVGGESELDGRDQVIKLSSNEGAFGPSPKAQEAYRQAAGNLHRYPDGGAGALREAIGVRHGLDAAKIVCGAGSDELISLLCLAYAGPGDEVLYSEHGFLMYPIAAQVVGAAPVSAPEVELTSHVDSLLQRVSDNTRLLFLANPNNPTGTYLSGDEMKRLRQELRDDVILVIDAAYAEYATRDDYSPGIDLVDAAANVVMTRTFSKIYGLGGARLGWAYCPADIAGVLNRIRGPFNVSAPAMAAGLAVVVTAAASGGIVEQSGAGIVVPPGDADAIADALDRLTGDAELAREMGLAGRRAVQQPVPDGDDRPLHRCGGALIPVGGG